MLAYKYDNWVAFKTGFANTVNFIYHAKIKFKIQNSKVKFRKYEISNEKKKIEMINVEIILNVLLPSIGLQIIE